MIDANKISALVQKNNTQLLNIRRHIHAHPELSYEEFKTAAYVESILQSWGVTHTRCTPTGIVAILEGRKSKSNKVIALRADMDALPIEEETTFAFRSKNKGVMHACGHDVHTTCLLGAIHTLLSLQNEWEGKIKCIFQPGEEKNPGGASLMIKAGVLKQAPIPKAIVGLHILPSLEAGKASFNTGKVMASADEIYITIQSKGGHAATPHLTQDSVYIASKIVIDLQEIISRRKNPLLPSVLSMCSIQGGHTTNIIPTEVKLKGTFRSLDETWRYEAHKLIKQYIQGVEKSSNAKIELDISVGYPCVINDDTVTAISRQAAENLIGIQNVVDQDIRMGAEDFGYYSQLIPACFFRIGSGRKEAIRKQAEHGLHTPFLHVDEKCIPLGASLMTYIALAQLNEM